MEDSLDSPCVPTHANIFAVCDKRLVPYFHVLSLHLGYFQLGMNGEIRGLVTPGAGVSFVCAPNVSSGFTTQNTLFGTDLVTNLQAV